MRNITYAVWRGGNISQSGAFYARRAFQGKQKIYWDWPNILT